MDTRLIRALQRASEASNAAAGRLELLTWALLVFTIVIAAFTVALFFHD
jgi:hypothetical protein